MLGTRQNVHLPKKDEYYMTNLLSSAIIECLFWEISVPMDQIWLTYKGPIKFMIDKQMLIHSPRLTDEQIMSDDLDDILDIQEILFDIGLKHSRPQQRDIT